LFDGQDQALKMARGGQASGNLPDAANGRACLQALKLGQDWDSERN
jgi:hypothetical protein